MIQTSFLFTLSVSIVNRMPKRNVSIVAMQTFSSFSTSSGTKPVSSTLQHLAYNIKRLDCLSCLSRCVSAPQYLKERFVTHRSTR